MPSPKKTGRVEKKSIMTKKLNYAKKLIMDQRKKEPMQDAESLIDDVMKTLVKEIPLTDEEKQEWQEIVTEIVNNYT